VGWNLDEIGYKVGQTVYHVAAATVNREGEPEYEPYSDEWLTAREWKVAQAAIRRFHKGQSGSRVRARKPSPGTGIRGMR